MPAGVTAAVSVGACRTQTGGRQSHEYKDVEERPTGAEELVRLASWLLSGEACLQGLCRI